MILLSHQIIQLALDYCLIVPQFICCINKTGHLLNLFETFFDKFLSIRRLDQEEMLRDMEEDQRVAGVDFVAPFKRREVPLRFP